MYVTYMVVFKCENICMRISMITIIPLDRQSPCLIEMQRNGNQFFVTTAHFVMLSHIFQTERIELLKAYSTKRLELKGQNGLRYSKVDLHNWDIIKLVINYT